MSHVLMGNASTEDKIHSKIVQYTYEKNFESRQTPFFAHGQNRRYFFSHYHIAHSQFDIRWIHEKILNQTGRLQITSALLSSFIPHNVITSRGTTLNIDTHLIVRFLFRNIFNLPTIAYKGYRTNTSTSSGIINLNGYRTTNRPFAPSRRNRPAHLRKPTSSLRVPYIPR